MDILHNVETQALDLRDDFPTGGFMPLDGSSALIELPLERTLYRPPFRPLIAGVALDEGDAEIDTEILYAQVVVDRAELLRNIRLELQTRSQVTLGEVVARHPLHNGLAELVAYLQLAGEWPRTTVDEGVEEQVQWQSPTGTTREATLPRIILLRNG